MLRCRGSLLNASGDFSACVPCGASGVHFVLMCMSCACVFLVAHVMFILYSFWCMFWVYCTLRCKGCVYCSHCGAFMFRKVLRTVAWTFFRVILGKMETEEESEFKNCLQNFQNWPLSVNFKHKTLFPSAPMGVRVNESDDQWAQWLEVRGERFSRQRNFGIDEQKP